MKRRLGKGATALALLVERDGQEHVLKVALSPEHNDRLHAEADVLGTLRHQYIVELHEVLTFKDRMGNDRVGLLMARAGDATLADRLREEGRLHLELLERFGEDLLTTIDWLEKKGIPHRDVKPENLGTAKNRQPAPPRALRLLARAHACREHPGRHARLPRPVPADAEAAALGHLRGTVRDCRDAVSDGGGIAAAVGGRTERAGRPRLRSDESTPMRSSRRCAKT